MLPSVILNALLILLNLLCTVIGLRRAPASKLFRYFTTLSNLLCAAAAAAVLCCYALGELPLWVIVFKYAGTCAVTVTMLTVLLYLLPASGDWRLVLYGTDMILHVICPLMAIASFLFFEKTDMPAWVMAPGVAPVMLYAVLYCRKVVFAPEARRWEDFYGFNYKGKWPISCAAMTVLAGLTAFALWKI